jgi:hypothetical protein
MLEQRYNLNMERDMLAQGLDHLRELGVTVIGARDGTVTVQSRGAAEELTVQVKARPTPASIQALAQPAAAGTLLVTAYMPDPLGALARQLGVNFVDLAGNAFLMADGLHIDVRGRRSPQALRPIDARPSRALKGMGQRITFVLLADPDGAEFTLRDVAYGLGLSVGTVQGAIKDLEEAGYVSSDGRQRRLHRTRELLDRWVDAYSLDLQFQLSLGRFDAPDPSWWQHADESLRRTGALWGGETAAHRMDPHLRPGRSVVYATSVQGSFIAENRLTRADGEGSVDIRKRFWHLRDDERLIVPTPLIYADLMASADPRLLAAAADLRSSDALLQRLDHG